MDASLCASIFFGRFVHVVRCSHLSGLVMRLEAPYPTTGFPDPVSIDRLPLLAL